MNQQPASVLPQWDFQYCLRCGEPVEYAKCRYTCRRCGFAIDCSDVFTSENGQLSLFSR